MPNKDHCIECDKPLSEPLETLVCAYCQEILDDSESIRKGKNKTNE